jgi:hypothetical protein
MKPALATKVAQGWREAGRRRARGGREANAIATRELAAARELDARFATLVAEPA